MVYRNDNKSITTKIFRIKGILNKDTSSAQTKNKQITDGRSNSSQMLFDIGVLKNYAILTENTCVGVSS